MRILITSGGWKASPAVMESLTKRGHDVCLLDHDIYSAGFHSRFCKEGIICAEEKDGTEYVNSIVAIIKSSTFDLLIPISDFATEHLSMDRGRISPYTRMLLPSKELIEAASCKEKTYRFAIEHDIDVPWTYFPQSLSDVTRCVEKIAFPCVVENLRGTAGKTTAYFYEKRSLVRYFTKLDTASQWPLIQEFAYGEFFEFMAVAQEGELVDCVMVKVKHYPCGAAPYCESAVDDKLLAIAVKIIKLLNWTGAVNMDFIKERSGELRLLEINPRLSDSTVFACKLGVDLPVIYARLANERPLEKFKSFRYRPGVMFRSVFPSELLLALGEKKYFLNLFANFLNLSMKSDIPWGDPGLAVWKLMHTLWYWQDVKRCKSRDLRPSLSRVPTF